MKQRKFRKLFWWMYGHRVRQSMRKVKPLPGTRWAGKGKHQYLKETKK